MITLYQMFWINKIICQRVCKNIQRPNPCDPVIEAVTRSQTKRRVIQASIKCPINGPSITCQSSIKCPVKAKSQLQQGQSKTNIHFRNDFITNKNYKPRAM